MADLVVVADDERVHLFRHEAPGQFKHYSRARWENSAAEREEDARLWSISECFSWIEAHKAGGNFKEITDDEMNWIKTGLARGYNGQSAVEPEADPKHVKPEPEFTCVDCGQSKPLSERRKFSWSNFPDNRGYCPTCFNRRAGNQGFGFGFGAPIK